MIDDALVAAQVDAAAALLGMPLDADGVAAVQLPFREEPRP